MAAAAALSRSRGVAGVRATKGLFSIFTLLCLVCLSSSWIHKDELREMRQKLQEYQRQMDSVKAQYKSKLAVAPELMSEFRSLMDPLIAFLKKASIECPVFLQLEGPMENIKDLMEKNSKKTEELDLQMQMTVKQLEKSEKFIKFLEEQEDEL